MKIALVGASSSRKSTVGYNLVGELKKRGLAAELVQEFARKYLEQFGSIDHPSEQLWLFYEQKKLEEQAAQNYKYTVCDSASFLSYAYYLMFRHGYANKPEKFWYGAHLLDDMCIEAAKSYDRIFLLEPAEFIDDGVRVRQSEQDRRSIYECILGYMQDRDIPYTTVSGSTEERIRKVMQEILDA